MGRKKAVPGGYQEKVTFLMTKEELLALDEECEKLSAQDPFGRRVGRSDVLRLWIKRGREAKGRS